MTFPFTKGTPKQQLVMSDFKKMAVYIRFMLKHCHCFQHSQHQVEKGMLQYSIIIST
jgi:hypothetical protein